MRQALTISVQSCPLWTSSRHRRGMGWFTVHAYREEKGNTVYLLRMKEILNFQEL